MTTRHSSSHLATPTTLLDSICQPIPLGKEIGRGGEGNVYEVEGQPAQVAKVYHKRPLPDDQVAKLQNMISRWNSDLETIAAWPRALLFDPSQRKPCGIIMTKMAGARPLHELYGTTNRRRHFPEAGWHHLVLAARNTAAAFHTLHSAGIVVGDVNQGNLLVDQAMCVRMIDCDSFQVTNGETTFHCPVGTPHFTPPELQSQKLRDVIRTGNHDRFGLAILIFHLLFVGRHPFAGRYHGPGDLSIEKAIAERRFAFSKNRSETLVEPPPASLLLDDLPLGIGKLFESAFRNPEGTPRPSPLEWIQQLETLIKRRKTCKFDSSHVYSLDSADCPWCRIEDAGGPTFFVPSGGTTIISNDRLAVLDEKILMLEQITFEDLMPRQLALPHIPALRKVKERAKIGSPEVIAALLVASWAVCLLGAIFGGAYAGAALAAGTGLSVLFAAALSLSKKARERRKSTNDSMARLDAMRENLSRRAQMIEAQHCQREATFKRANDELESELENYRTAADDIQTVLVRYRETQKTDFLRGFLIRDYFRKISGLTPSHVVMMESFGVESANDVDRLKLAGIPMIDPDILMELMSWRTEVERQYVFKPEHGITLADVGHAKDLAVRKYKISQARKVLTGAKQLETLAEVGKAELELALSGFNREREQWSEAAKEFRDVQSRRLGFERLLNSSPAIALGLAFGVPFAAFILYLFFGR